MGRKVQSGQVRLMMKACTTLRMTQSRIRYDALMNDPPSLKRKVVRGGSWKDIGYYMQAGTRAYEYQDTTKAYIGFRSVMTYLGRGKAVNAEDL